MLLRVTLGNHSSAEGCEDFHARAAIAGTSSCNLLFIQIPDDFQRIPSNFNYSAILWNSFYSPNWLSPSRCFILLLLGGVAYSQCLLKLVGLASFNTVLSQTQSKKSTAKQVLESCFPEMVLKTVLSTSLLQTQQWPYSAGLPENNLQSTADVSVPRPKRLSGGTAPWHHTREG